MSTEPAAPKKRGRASKTARADEPATEEVLPTLSVEDQAKVDLEDWYRAYTYDDEEELNTWELKQLSMDKDPVRRGTLVVVTGPVTGGDKDLDDVDRLTSAVNEEFGDVVNVEHRVQGTTEDNLFEVWIEAYEHDLLFSRRSAVYGKEWEGARDLGEGEEEVGRIINLVKDAVSDDAKFSYRV